MLQMGPMVRSWTIRHEAKLNFFKQTTGTSSFKNITLSLANHHQRLVCYEMSTGSLLRSRYLAIATSDRKSEYIIRYPREWGIQRYE